MALFESAQRHATTGARTNFESKPLDIVPRVYFSGTEDVSEFVTRLDDYIAFNNIADTKKYLLLHCSLTGDALLWLNNIGKFLITDETKRYEQTIAELKKAFTFKDTTAFRTEFFSQQQSVYMKGSQFLLRKLELKNRLDLDLSFCEFLLTILPLFHTVLQDYIELKSPKSSAELYQILLNYESRHDADCRVAGSSFRQRGSLNDSQLLENSNCRTNGFRDTHRKFRGGNSYFQNTRTQDSYDRTNNYRAGHITENRSIVNRNNFHTGERNRPSFSNRGAVRNSPPARFNRLQVDPDGYCAGNYRRHRSEFTTRRCGSRLGVQQQLSVSTFNTLTINPVDLPKLLLVLDGIVVSSLLDSGAERCFLSFTFYKKYFHHKQLTHSNLKVQSAQGLTCVNKGVIDLNVEIRSMKFSWQFQVIEGLNEHCIIGIDFLRNKGIDLNFFTNTVIVNTDTSVTHVESPPLLVNLEEVNLIESEKQLFHEFLHEFRDVFSEKPGLTQVAWHEIDIGNADPVASKPYRYDTVKQKFIDYHIDKMLTDDIIMPINAPFASPVVLCRKNNGKSPNNPEAWRFAVDYRRLNAVTRNPQYPIPIIDDIFANITDTKFMSTLDLTTGYFQIAMKPEDIPKTTFITKNGCFAFKRMSFGLSGAPATFQKTMDKILKPLLGKGVLVYLDDIIVLGATFAEHLQLLREVFTLLRCAGLTVKFEKCKFLRQEIKYLGFKITQEGVKTDSEKTDAISEIPPPKNAKQVAKFLGMVAWFSKFIPKFSELCEPLYALKRKRVKFVWSLAAQTSFEKLKKALISSPVLAHPNYSLQFELFCDASSVGVGAMLSQLGRPIAYASRILNSAERNYSVTERECLAVIWALHKFRCYFNEIPVKVITDHSALTKLTNGKGLSSRMVRWSLKLAEYNVHIEHRAGKDNVVADALSRNPQNCMEENREMKVCALSAMVLNSREKLIQEQRNDPDFGALYRYLEDPDGSDSLNAHIFEKWSKSFKLIDGLLFYSKRVNSRGELRVFIPSNLRTAILNEFHDNPLAGHLGMRKTYDRLRDSCYFPKMRKIVRDYVATCNTCQKFNYRNISPAGKLISIKVTHPLQKLGLDLLGPYPLSHPERYRYVLVIVDYFSKWVEFIPLRKASAKAVADGFFNNFISKYGVPLEIVTDHGPCFVSEIFKELCNKLEISHIFTVPYRPQSNLSERVNRTLVQLISSYVGSQHSTWDVFLQHFAFALRTSVHESTGKTPAELFLGRKIITPFQRLVMVTDLEGNFVCQNLDKLVKEAQVQLNKAQKRQALYYNMKRRELEIKVGDFVLLEKHWLSSRRMQRVAKFGPKFVGPYKVLDVIQNNLILDVSGERMTVNMDQVRVYKFRNTTGSSQVSDSEPQNPQFLQHSPSSDTSQPSANMHNKIQDEIGYKKDNLYKRTHLQRSKDFVAHSQTSYTPPPKKKPLLDGNRRKRKIYSPVHSPLRRKRIRNESPPTSHRLNTNIFPFIPAHKKPLGRKRPPTASTIFPASEKRAKTFPPDETITQSVVQPHFSHHYRTRLQQRKCSPVSHFSSTDEISSRSNFGPPQNRRPRPRH